MITNLFDRNMVKILTLFSISPGSKFTRDEIKKKTLLNNVPLDNAINTLFKEQLIIKEKRFLSLNFENPNLRSIIQLIKKEHIRFKEIPLNVYFALLDLSKQLAQLKQIAHIYLFGSYAKLIYTEKSDIDLAIILKKEDIIKKIKNEIKKIEKRYNKIIEPHFFEKKDLKQKDPIIKEIKRNSIFLF